MSEFENYEISKRRAPNNPEDSNNKILRIYDKGSIHAWKHEKGIWQIVESSKPRNFETKKPISFDTKKPTTKKRRNQETKSQEAKKPKHFFIFK